MDKKYTLKMTWREISSVSFLLLRMQTVLEVRMENNPDMAGYYKDEVSEAKAVRAMFVKKMEEAD